MTIRTDSCEMFNTHYQHGIMSHEAPQSAGQTPPCVSCVILLAGCVYRLCVISESAGRDQGSVVLFVILTRHAISHQTRANNAWACCGLSALRKAPLFRRRRTHRIRMKGDKEDVCGSEKNLIKCHTRKIIKMGRKKIQFPTYTNGGQPLLHTVSEPDSDQAGSTSDEEQRDGPSLRFRSARGENREEGRCLQGGLWEYYGGWASKKIAGEDTSGGHLESIRGACGVYQGGMWQAVTHM